jgi:hypothetical protein
MFSRPLVSFVLTAAIRDKLILTLLLMILLGGSLSMFLGSSAITEQESFALVFGASGLRFLSVTGIVLFCCFYVRRSFETKEVEFLLSRPLSRMSFLLSNMLAFTLLALFVTSVLMLSVFFLGKPNLEGLFVWGLSIAVENILMAVTALFFSLVLSSAAGSALATLGFYVLCRLIGTLLGIAAQPPDNTLFLVLNKTMEAISVIIPRFDLMGQTSWLVYGVQGSGGIALTDKASAYAVSMLATLGVPGFIVAQGALFFVLLLAAASFDFSRRQF